MSLKWAEKNSISPLCLKKISQINNKMYTADSWYRFTRIHGANPISVGYRAGFMGAQNLNMSNKRQRGTYKTICHNQCMGAVHN